MRKDKETVTEQAVTTQLLYFGYGPVIGDWTSSQVRQKVKEPLGAGRKNLNGKQWTAVLVAPGGWPMAVPCGVPSSPPSACMPNSAVVFRTWHGPCGIACDTGSPLR